MGIKTWNTHFMWVPIILDMHCGINPHSSACCGPYVDAIPNHLHYTRYVSKAFKRCTEEDAQSDSLCWWWWFALLFVHSIPFITVQCLPHVFTNVISAIPSHLTQSWPSLIHFICPLVLFPCTRGLPKQTGVREFERYCFRWFLYYIKI
jgi:hypothetical protein